MISHERTNGPLKDTYGETFLRRLISLQPTNDRNVANWDNIAGRNVETTKQVSYEHYDILLRNKF